MTVKELIQELSRLNEDYEVYVKINKTIAEAVYHHQEVIVTKVKAGNGFIDIIGGLE